MVDYRTPPAKQLYLILQALLALVRVPWWGFVSLVPALRPNPRWSFTRAFFSRLTHRLATVDVVVQGFDGHPTHRAIAPGFEECAVWLEPVPALVVGELAALAQTAQVDGVRVPGYWLHRPGSDLAYDAPPAPSEKVVLAFHGGSYVVRSANPADPSMGFAHALLAHVPAIQRVLGVEYRLSTSLMGHAPNPFPAALLDALAAYAHLVKVLGVRPADVVLAGSSAGGNLALALVRYLVEHRAALAPAGLGVPGGVVLFSPWADMGTSHAAPLASYFARADWLPAGAYPATVYAGPHGTGFLDTSAYASPASAHLRAPLPSYAGWPRTFIACGSRETFAPMVRTLRDRMAADLGQDRGDGVGPGAVYYYEEADAVHDFASNVRHEPERTRVMKKVAGWIAP